MPMPPDRHHLYEAAVQGVEYDLDLFERMYRRRHGRSFLRLREDFCGTAQLAAAWALRGGGRTAVGVDLDPAVLAWTRRHRFARMGGVADRVTLECRDVRAASRPRVDVVCALNYSYWVFQRRAELLDYFRAARRSLAPGGLLVLSAFGGSGAMETLTERRRIAASQTVDGDRLPAFTYVWEQARFNPVDHRLVSYIHFRLPGGREFQRAFRYDWRMWTLPELHDALREAGFGDTETWVEDWDDENDRPGDTHVRRRHFEQMASWLAFVVGVNGRSER
jgi:SAM-dependent methyltransferase